ncbi:MAG: FAD:protein FMN transferase [Dehalococcoidia bacterium]
MTAGDLPPASGAPTMVRHELRAMNSTISLVCCAPDGARRLHRAARWLTAYEGRFSRFLSTSEVSRLNASAGRPFRASPGLFNLLRLALGFARRSGGLFDPTVLAQLEAAGYDRSFEMIPTMRRAPRTVPRGRPSWQNVHLDPATRTITMPETTRIDLGGIGKGWAVDRLAAQLGLPCLVNGGGDVFAGGRPPAAAAWLVGVADPFQPERDLMVLTVRDRGVATSSSLKRRWKVGDAYVHHLIDPRTGAPSESDAVQVTAVAASATLSDYHAKIALLLGAEGGLAYLDREPGVEGLVVRRDGVASETGGLVRYRERAAGEQEARAGGRRAGP